jgi:hypothetical protein
MRSRGRAARGVAYGRGPQCILTLGRSRRRKSIERAAEVPQLLLYKERLIYEQSLIEGG